MVGNSNWLPGYGSLFGKNADADSYASTMKLSYVIQWDYRPNAVVLDPNGVPPSPVIWPKRYDTGLYATLARDAWSADFRSWMVSWLSTH